MLTLLRALGLLMLRIKTNGVSYSTLKVSAAAVVVEEEVVVGVEVEEKEDGGMGFESHERTAFGFDKDANSLPLGEETEYT